MTSGTQGLSAKKKLFVTLLIPAGALLFALLLAEGLLRLLQYPEDVLHRFDPDFGPSLIPDHSGWNLKENKASFSTNSFGLLGEEISRTKPPGVFRIALLGDSYVEGIQVAHEDRMTTRLQQKLRERGIQAEVLNFGLSGFGTANQLFQLERRVFTFEPDLVILAFYPGNDYWDNRPERAAGHGFIRYTLDDAGEPVFDETLFQEAAERARQRQTAAFARLRSWLGVHSALVRLVRLAQRLCTVEGPPDFVTPADLAPLLPEPLPAFAEMIPLTHALIRQMAKACRQRGVGFFLVQLTMPIQVDPQMWQEALRHYPGLDITLPDRRLGEFAAAENIPYLGLYPDFAAFQQTHGVFLHGFGPTPGYGHWGHFNETGHDLAATLIARGLVEEGFVR